MNDNNTGQSANNVFRGMLRSQLISTVVVALIAYFISGMHAGLSALAGGLSVFLAALVASKIAQGKSNQAATILMRMLKAELVKIILIVVFLYLVFKGYKELVPGALIAGLAVAAIISGASISKQNDNLI
ncbi:MAG: ATP synthase subunit I [Methylotenera sp.]|jgi:ATP synthase protein I